MRAILVPALRLGIGSCAAVILVALFVDPAQVEVGGLRFDPLLLAARSLAVLLAIAAVLHGPALRARLEALCAGEAEGRRLERRLLALLVGIGFLLRFARFHEYGLNPDEAQFVWWGAADTLAEVWRFELAKSPHPPANFFLMHAILGLTWNLFWLRLPAVLSGTFLIWITHRFARGLLGPGVALAAAFLVCFSPALVDLSRVCRNYAPGFAVLVTALVFLARWLESGRWRDQAAFAGLATFAALWHYGFVAVFVGVDVALAILLLRRRAPLSVWAGVVALQLPLAALLLGLYVEHVTGLRHTVVAFHQNVYADMLQGAEGNPLRPFADLWQYLMRRPAAPLLAVLGGIGLLDLALRRHWPTLLLCALPAATAYGLALADVMPLGATRHSTYLFPFLFVLAASQAPRLLAGYGWGRPWARRAGAATLVGVAVLVVESGLVFYRSPAGWAPLDPQLTGRELMTSYRQRDVDRAFALLEERVGPDDIVMVGFQGLMALRVHFRLVPLLDPTPDQERRGDARLALSDEPMRYEHAGVSYFYSRRMAVTPSPQSLLAGVDDVVRHFGLRRPKRVWTLRGAWNWPLAGRFAALDVEAKEGLEIAARSRGLLFVVDLEELEKVRRTRPQRSRLTPEKGLD